MDMETDKGSVETDKGGIQTDKGSMETDKGGVETGKGCVVIDTLDALQDGTIVNEKALAGIFGVNDRTIRRMVQRGELPPPFLFGGMRRWRGGDIKAHIGGLAERAQKEKEKEDAEKAEIASNYASF